MTVRAWFTISGLAIAALGAAFLVWMFGPIPSPEIRVRVGDVRLEGNLVRACWPQRGDDLRCERGEVGEATSLLPQTGEFLVTAAYPAQPEDGFIVVRDGDGQTIIRSEWMRTLAYEFPPGDYVLTAEGRYPAEAFVRYSFRFSVTRSGD